MKCAVLALFGLVLQATLASAANVEADKNRPVNKVIELLKNMQAQLTAEQKEDEEIYDKLACWCETNEKAKTAAIAAAEEKISHLVAEIEEKTALVARLEVEITNLADEIERNEKALAQATEIRRKEHEEFVANEKELLQSIASLKAALVVLSKHYEPPTETLLHIAAMVRHQVKKHKARLSLSPVQMRAVASFVQQPTFFDKAPAFKQAYNPGGSVIYGILVNMKDTFEADLAQAQKEETEAQEQYEALKAAKEAEIAAGKEQLAQKKDQLAKTEEELAQAKTDLDDTRESLAADQQYLRDLKEKCAVTDAEWEERQKTRQQELEAVAQAIAILSADDAHDTFTRTFNSGSMRFEQTSSHKDRREKAYKILKAAAKKANDPALLSLATSVQLDAFTRVKKAIDDMVSVLLKDQADEVAHKDWCVTETNANGQATVSKERDLKDVEALIESLHQKIDQMTKEIAQLQAEIKDAQIQIKRAGEDRAKENVVFQQTVTDQRETQRLLQMAHDVMAKVYASLMQGDFTAGPAPPPGFAAYQKNQGAAGVLALIQQIMGECKAMEAEAVQAEQDSQAAYETFVKDSNAQIAADQRSIVEKEDQKSKAEVDLAAADADKVMIMKELEELANYASQLHASCDFIVRNFDIRQAARAQEIEALRQAKAILSGANFGGSSLLAKKK